MDIPLYMNGELTMTVFMAIAWLQWWKKACFVSGCCSERKHHVQQWCMRIDITVQQT